MFWFKINSEVKEEDYFDEGMDVSMNEDLLPEENEQSHRIFLNPSHVLRSEIIESVKHKSSRVKPTGIDVEKEIEIETKKPLKIKKKNHKLYVVNENKENSQEKIE